MKKTCTVTYGEDDMSGRNAYLTFTNGSKMLTLYDLEKIPSISLDDIAEAFERVGEDVE